jgi:hypothetical protein
MKSSTPARSSRLSFTFVPPGIRDAATADDSEPKRWCLAPALHGPARIWSQDCDVSGEPGSSGRCVDVQRAHILLLLERRMTCKAIALGLSALGSG